MSIAGLRVFLFTLLPLLVAGIQIVLNKSSQSRERKLEVFLLYLFGLDVAGSGIGGFIAHFFLSDIVAESVGWPAGNPFQLEIAFANLAPGNTVQNVNNLLRPALLIGFLVASRRAERAPDSEAGTPAFEIWRQPRAQAVGVMTATVATGFGIGFAIDQPFLSSAIAIVVGLALIILIISRAPDEPGAAATSQPS